MIHPTALIGDDPEHREFQEGDPSFTPAIAPTARIGAYVTVDAGLKRATRVGRSWLMKHVHVGHDAQIGHGCEIAPHCSIGGHVEIADNVKVGQGAVFKPFVKIGQGARIGCGAVVVTDVPPGEIWAGNPAKKLEKPREPGAATSDRLEWSPDWPEARAA